MQHERRKQRAELFSVLELAKMHLPSKEKIGKSAAGVNAIEQAKQEEDVDEDGLVMTQVLTQLNVMVLVSVPVVSLMRLPTAAPTVRG